MSNSARATEGTSVQRPTRRRFDDQAAQQTIFAGGSVLGAVAMSSCCIVPLVLFSLGITGAWIGNLAALSPYQPYFFIASATFLGFGFHRVYRKPSLAACDARGQCGTLLSIRVTKAALWVSTVLVLAALAFPYYAPVLLDT